MSSQDESSKIDFELWPVNLVNLPNLVNRCDQICTSFTFNLPRDLNSTQLLSMNPHISLAALFLAIKAVQLTVLATVPSQFDISSRILLSTYAHEKVSLCHFNTSNNLVNALLAGLARLLLDVLDRLVAWDAVYFSDLFANDIQFEHQYVFCPLWWRLIRALPSAGFYNKLVIATVLANTCHFLAAVVLYHYTYAVFQSARIFSAKRMAFASLALFVLSPAGVFLTAPYSESIAALFSFLCLYLREISLGSRLGAKPNRILYVVSGFAAALAFGFRANCLLLGVIYVYDLRNMHVLPVLTGLVLGLAFCVSQVANYTAICLDGKRGGWCLHAVPSLYAYAQSHYWNNGFLKYWTFQNLPNFVFGAPTFLLLVASMRYFARIYPVDRILPVLMVNCVFLVLLLCFWHVQIVTRIHTFLPVVYWLVAGMLTQNEPSGAMNHAILAYFVGWNVLQTALFGAFLPPA